MFNNVFYSKKEHQHVCDEGSDWDEGDKFNISGTQVREMIKANQQPPEWFMRPEISKLILDQKKKGKSN